MSEATARLLDDGRRLHLQHGPIDLIVEAFGDDRERLDAYRQAEQRFASVLVELVEELPRLRSQLRPDAPRFEGKVAERMRQAALPHCSGFITPMAAVAGAVADEVLEATVAGRKLAKAYVNNGGDAAIHLTPGEKLDVAIAGGSSRHDRAVIKAETRVRGVATSGWRGRSQSLGIADAVTVLARSAASADAAATIIANAVDLPDHPKISRQPASDIDPDSDLGDRLVTTAVASLTALEARTALTAGGAVAEKLIAAGEIEGAALFLAGETLQHGVPGSPEATDVSGSMGGPAGARIAHTR